MSYMQVARSVQTVLNELIHFLRWRLFRRPIIAKPDNVVSFAKAAIALHNFLQCTECSVYCSPGYVNGEYGEGNVMNGSWREEESFSSMLPVAMTSSNR